MADPKVVPITTGSAAKGSRHGSSADMLAAGAARASGERAKRRRTPLLTDSSDEVAPRPPRSSFDVRATSVHRPRPVPKSGRVPVAKAARSSVSTSSRRVAAKTAQSSPATGRVGAGVEELVTFAIATLRRAAAASGLSGDDIERQVAATLSFVRRRLSGDYTVDDFGFDEASTENAYLPLLRPLYKSWFRVEVRGIENIPSSGGALIVANHSARWRWTR